MLGIPISSAAPQGCRPLLAWCSPKESPSPGSIGRINILRMIKITDGRHWHGEEKSQIDPGGTAFHE